MKSEIFLRKKYGKVKINIELTGDESQQAKAIRQIQDDVWLEIDEMAKTVEEKINTKVL